MKSHLPSCLLLIAMAWTTSPAPAHAAAPASLDAGFRETVLPFVEDYCLTCHDAGQKKGDLDLSVYADPDAVIKDLAPGSLSSKSSKRRRCRPRSRRSSPRGASVRK